MYDPDPMGDRLQGKVALISGGARGMGAAEARLFVAEGARVVVGDVLVDEGKALADELGGAVRFVELDVTSEESWQAAVNVATSEFGGLDVLVNNAGIWKVMPLLMTTAEDYMQVVRVNQLGVFLGMKTAVPAMVGSGSIVNISSVAGLTGAVGQIAYGASKWAVRGMTKIAALELAAGGIRVNSVHPGLIKTPMMTVITDEWGLDPEVLLKPSVPQGRLGTAEDVAPVVLFLASDESSHVTGGEYSVDGGMTAGFAPRAQ